MDDAHLASRCSLCGRPYDGPLPGRCCADLGTLACSESGRWPCPSVAASGEVRASGDRRRPRSGDELERCRTNPGSGSAPDVRLGDDEEVIADFDDHLDSRILMAGHDHETVGGFHGALVLSE
jgi:hypothetical protein